jgi:uncharacterized protein (DUF169 family)
VFVTITKDDLAVLLELGFEAQPVGVKYSLHPIPGMTQLDKNLALCEMLKAAFAGDSFYAGVKNHLCDAGSYILGQMGLTPPYISGEYGAGLGVFYDTRAAGRIYHYIPRIEKGVVNYVALCPLDRIAFEPDVLIVLADTTQAEILLRAMSYKTGAMWHSRYSSAIGCAWLFAYPYLSGEMNFISTGLGFGMRRRKLFPEGKQFISIPLDQMASTLQILQEMPWTPRSYQPDGMEFVRELRIRLGIDPPDETQKQH